MQQGCEEAGVCLIGGETAEHPNVYLSPHLELAGFGVGLVTEKNRLGPDLVKEGDVLLGLVSSGVHSNGFSLIRSIFGDLEVLKSSPLLDQLLTPTIIYVKDFLTVCSEFPTKIHAAAHITGEGLEHNVSRVVPSELVPVINWESLTIPKVFLTLQELGQIDPSELRRVFNCGIGFVVIVDREVADLIQNRLRALGKFTVVIGSVQKKPVDF